MPTIAIKATSPTNRNVEVDLRRDWLDMGMAAFVPYFSALRY
jgi:hypothetical protein